MTFRKPNAAPLAMVTFAVNCVAEPKTQELTVMPAPKLHVAALERSYPSAER